MGWDDAPPDADLKAADWTSAPPDDDLKSDYWGDVKQNALAGLKQWPQAAETMAGQAAKIGNAMGPGSMLQSGAEVLGGKPIEETPIGEGAQALYDVGKGTLGGVWQGIKDTGSLVKAPFEYLGGTPMSQTDIGEKFRERPLSVPVGVASTVAPMLKMLRLGGAGEGAAGAAAAGAGDDVFAGVAKKAPIGETPVPDISPELPSETPLPEPPPPGAETPPPAGAGAEPHPLQQLYETLLKKGGPAYEKQAAQPGQIEGMGRYLQNEAQKMAGHDLGIQPRQIQSMGPGYAGLEKAEALLNYAGDKGYFDIGLTDLARKAKIKQVLQTSGDRIGAIRDIADNRGAPPLAEMRDQLETQLTDKYGIKAPNEIKDVLKYFDQAAKKDPTYSGMADLATTLNADKTTAVKLGQHPGPTTDGANIISRINNDSIRSVLNPKEAELYSQDLDDYGAHKKLEQIDAAAGRRGLGARTNQRGIFGKAFQEFLDRAGYRGARKVMQGVGKTMVSNPERFKTLPGMFEEFAHESGEALDDAAQGPQFAHGGIVGEVQSHIGSKYANR